MNAFTFGSVEGRAAVIDAARVDGAPFTATFNLSDSQTLFRALRDVSTLSPDLAEADRLASLFAQHIPNMERTGGKVAVVWSPDELRVALDALCDYGTDGAHSVASGIAEDHDVEWV